MTNPQPASPAMWREVWREEGLEPYWPLIERWRECNLSHVEMLYLLALRGVHENLARDIVEEVGRC